MNNLSRTRARTVAVEGFDVEPVQNSIKTHPVQSAEVSQSTIGLWWDLVCLIPFVAVVVGVIFTDAQFLSWTDVIISELLVVIGVVMGVISGNLGNPISKGRYYFAFSLLGLGVLSFIISLLFKTPNSSMPWIAYSITSIVGGWATLRMSGDSLWRAVSFGLAIASPIFFTYGFLHDVLTSFGEATYFWLVQLFADWRSIPFTTEDSAIQFMEGTLDRTNLFGNAFGILIPVCLVVALAVFWRRSLIVCAINLVIVTAWWSVLRSTHCIWLIDSGNWNVLTSDYAMSIGLFFALIVLTVMTDAFVGTLLAPIPVDQLLLDFPALAQWYNWCVSFPQLGPINGKLLEMRIARAAWNDQEEDEKESAATVGLDDLELEQEGMNIPVRGSK